MVPYFPSPLTGLRGSACALQSLICRSASHAVNTLRVFASDTCAANTAAELARTEKEAKIATLINKGAGMMALEDVVSMQKAQHTMAEVTKNLGDAAAQQNEKFIAAVPARSPKA
eukprot:tig00000269_g23738.t1